LLGIGKYAEAADIVGKTTIIYLSYRPIVNGHPLFLHALKTNNEIHNGGSTWSP